MPLLLLTLACVSACGAPDEAGPPPQEAEVAGEARGGGEISDSAGVPVVTNPAPDPDGTPRWRLAAAPLWQIGEAGGAPEYRFTGLSGGVLLAGGGVAVTDQGSAELRVYDGGGRHVRSAGGAGEGPGELRAPILTGAFAGDSLLVFDAQLRRASVFTAEGRYARTVTPTGAASVEFPVVVGVLGDGGMLVYEGPVYAPGVTNTGVLNVPARIHRLTPRGQFVGLLGEFPGGQVSLLVEDMSLTASSVAFSPDFHLAAKGERVAAGSSASLSVRIYDLDGNLRRIVRQRRDPVPVEPGDFEAARQAAVARAQDALARERAERRWEMMPRHAHFPAFASLRLERSGNLWVEEYRTPRTGAALWQVFDPEGHLLAQLEIPQGLRVFDVEGEHLLAGPTEGGVERLAVYRIEKSRAGG